jgi:hypothetical protein
MTISSHAAQRCNDRRISLEELNLVMKYGTRIHRTGALFCFMRRRDIPGDVPAFRAGRLEGLTLILDPEETSLITAYRNRSGLHEIKRKSKRFHERRHRAALAA